MLTILDSKIPSRRVSKSDRKHFQVNVLTGKNFQNLKFKYKIR